LDLDSSGKIFAKCQVNDYRWRGEALSGHNMIDFFVNTFEEAGSAWEQESEGVDSLTGSDQCRKRGRPRNERVPYLDQHPRARNLHRVLRSKGHNNLPNFIGRYFPRRDDTEIHSFYCACMLMLLKPWRNISTDLKSTSQSWEEAFNEFLSGAPPRVHSILSGIQYFHDCESVAKDHHMEVSEWDKHRSSDEDVDALDHELGEDVPIHNNLYSEEGLAHLIASQVSFRELLHGRFAIEYAKQAKIFSADDLKWMVQPSSSRRVTNATGDDLQRLMSWKSQMEEDVRRQNVTFTRPDDISTGDRGSVTCLGAAQADAAPGPIVSALLTHLPEASLVAADPLQLKADQFRAYDIISWHLEETLAGRNPPRLQMILYGEGGTGKSKVIQTVTERFVQKDALFLLLKSAYTGVAASIINGKTTHIIISLSNLMGL
jgi:hypothetical protein